MSGLEAALLAYLIVGAVWALYRWATHWREYLKGWPTIIMPWYATLFMLLCVLVAMVVGCACVAAAWPFDLWKWTSRDRGGDES